MRTPTAAPAIAPTAPPAMPQAAPPVTAAVEVTPSISRCEDHKARTQQFANACGLSRTPSQREWWLPAPRPQSGKRHCEFDRPCVAEHGKLWQAQCVSVLSASMAWATSSSSQRCCLVRLRLRKRSRLSRLSHSGAHGHGWRGISAKMHWNSKCFRSAPVRPSPGSDYYTKASCGEAQSLA